MTDKREIFEKVWTAPSGFRDWFATVNNQPFGNRFMLAGMIFFFLAGIMALLMRVQLAVPNNDFMGPDVYNQLFTMHGSTMMFLVILPFIEGMAVYLLPQMLGTREMAFPRMSAFSFWVFFPGGLLFFTGFLFNAVPDAGWFAYPPLSLSEYSGLGVDFLLVGLGFIEIAGMGAGVEVAVTILKFRAPGMSLGRMPLFAWAWLVTSIMIIFAFATLFGATVLIEFDRAIGTHFFNAAGGGTPLLWQHLFWFFGHPDVYIMFIPATGIVSMIVPTFAKRPIAGYPLVAVAIIVTGFMSFGLWAHHMFTTGLPPMAMTFFAAASLMIALASGTQVFAWIATLWRTKPEIKTPLLYVLGFLFLFVLGGFTGVMVAVLPFDLQAHDTHFVVAHFHYVLIGGVIFPVLGGLHYWLPLINGKMPGERLGKWSFWLIFIGFNIAFLPMHLSGLMGMARRVYTYPESLGIGGLNLVSTIGSFVLGIGFALVPLNVLLSLRRGEKAPRNPWGSSSLEWSKTADMPNYVFLQPPVVYDHEPLSPSGAPEKKDEELERIAAEMRAAPAEWRAALVTDVVSGRPQAVQKVAGPSYVPIVAAIFLFLTSVATLAQSYLAALALLAFFFITIAYWLWPRDSELAAMEGHELALRTGLPLEPTGTAASGWWATMGILAILATVFSVLFYSYFYIRLYSDQWPQGGVAKPGLLGAAVAYGLLLASGAPLYAAGRGLRIQSVGITVTGLIAAAALALAAMVLTTLRLLEAGFSPRLNAYASIFHALTWHVLILEFGGALLLLAAAVRVYQWRRSMQRGYLVLQMQITGLYWYFAIAVGAITYLVLYLSPHIL